MKWDNLKNDIPQERDIWDKLQALPDEEPGPDLSRRFYAALENEAMRLDQQEKPAHPLAKEPWNTRNWFSRQPAWQFAATLLLLGLGFAGGYFYQTPLRQTLQEVQKEADTVRTDLSMSMLDRSSAQDRLAGIRQTALIEEPDDTLVRRLLELITSDENTQVRLAAVEAVYIFGDRPAVREAVTASLSRQTSPLMQVALMDLLVAWRDKQAVSSLKALAENGRLDPQVQTRAQESIGKLL
jgi:hypothetical protein